LNPATPAEHLKYVLEDLDLILVMTVNPGFGGQKFLQPVVPKIKALRQMMAQAGLHDVRISVDGGINPQTAKIVVEAGADVLVAGNALYGAPDMSKAIAELRASSSSPAQKV
jgi:ribulose-phosphate 3-epimerase